ncbi:glycosyltransferase family 2 protein [Nocardioides aurantiacus]|uniref:glycosyltransferase family 2 protein n=1 Tax=Nocardioides aurantiacus TaxID=86796 RepID=UPI00403FA157
MSASRVTTVVITRDRWPDLTVSLPRHRGPVVLVDNASQDGTPERVRAAFPHVEVVELPENLGAVGRNVGGEAARTPYVAFADDDSWWAPGALERAADYFDRHPRLALLAARILVGEAEELDPICRLMDGPPLPVEDDLPGRSVLGFIACGSVVRREAFLACGGFDEVVEFAGEEERLTLDLAAAGWGLAYVDDVVAHHHPSTARQPGAARLARLTRNEVLTAVMRRSWPDVARTVARSVLAGPHGPRGVVEAVPRVPRALRQRRPVPAAVEETARLLG